MEAGRVIGMVLHSTLNTSSSFIPWLCSRIFSELAYLSLLRCCACIILPFHLLSTVSWFWIAFADNSIEDIPASFCNLIHLKSLCLNNNNINQVCTVQLKFYLSSLIIYVIETMIGCELHALYLFCFCFFHLHILWRAYLFFCSL